MKANVPQLPRSVLMASSSRTTPFTAPGIHGRAAQVQEINAENNVPVHLNRTPDKQVDTQLKHINRNRFTCQKTYVLCRKFCDPYPYQLGHWDSVQQHSLVNNTSTDCTVWQLHTDEVFLLLTCQHVCTISKLEWLLVMPTLSLSECCRTGD